MATTEKSATDPLIEKARTKALHAVKQWREECEKQAWIVDR